MASIIFTDLDVFSLNSLLNGNAMKIIEFDSPDVVIETSSTYILLEHFEFDSAKRNKRGSLQKEEEAQKERDYKAKLDSIEEANQITEVSYKATFETEKSLEYYKNNLVESFDKHIAKYNEYILNFDNNSSRLKKSVEFGFIIQNSSILPDVVIRGTDMIALTPFHLSDFRNKLKHYPQVTHIFYLMDTPNKNKFVYYANSKSLVDIETKLPIINGNYKFISWKPKHLRHTIIIPKK